MIEPAACGAAVCFGPHTWNFAKTVAMMLEAEQVARRLGASFRVDVERRIDGAARVGAHRTSMLQDFEAGKTIELDALLGVVCELGRMAGVDTPKCDMVFSLTRLKASAAG